MQYFFAVKIWNLVVFYNVGHINYLMWIQVRSTESVLSACCLSQKIQVPNSVSLCEESKLKVSLESEGFYGRGHVLGTFRGITLCTIQLVNVSASGFITMSAIWEEFRADISVRTTKLDFSHWLLSDGGSCLIHLNGT